MKTTIYSLIEIGMTSFASVQAAEVSTTTTTETTVSRFSPDEKRIIRKHVVVDKSVAPVSQKIVVGETLAPVIIEKARPIDQTVLVELPKQPEQTRLVVVGDQVVRIQEPSNKIIDVFDIDEIEDKL
jgi:hypothetical protein